MTQMSRSEVMQQCYEIPGQTWPVELGWLYDTFSGSMLHVEVGVYCGRSLFASCAAMSDETTIIGVDDESASWVRDNQWVKDVRSATYSLLKPKTPIHLSMNSVDAARWCHEQQMSPETVFIDGCHEYAECLADIQVWSSLMRPGSLIAGHDYWPVHTGVMEAVQSAFGGSHSTVSGTRIWFKRV